MKKIPNNFTFLWIHAISFQKFTRALLTNHCTSSNWPTTAYLYLLSKVCATSHCSKNENHNSIGKGHKINKNAGGCCQNKAFWSLKKGVCVKIFYRPISRCLKNVNNWEKWWKGLPATHTIDNSKGNISWERAKIFIFLNSSLHSLSAASFKKQTLKPW